MDLHGRLARWIRQQSWLREVLRSILTRIGRHEPGDRADIILFASGRGGSTWLMEIIAAEPGMRLVNEPLHPRKWHRIGLPAGGLDGRILLEIPAGYEPRVRMYLGDYRATRIDGPYDVFSRDFHFRTDRRVLKLDAASAEAIDALGLDYHIVYLLRHPIPTALSTIRSAQKGHWRPAFHLSDSAFVRRHICPDLQTRIRPFLNGSELQLWVLAWCLTNIGALRAIRSGSVEHWLVLTYEELALLPEATVGLLARRLELRAPQRLLDRIDQPSASTDPARISHVQARDALSRVYQWRSKVSAEDERQAFEVLEAFDLDAYEFGRPEGPHSSDRRGAMWNGSERLSFARGIPLCSQEASTPA